MQRLFLVTFLLFLVIFSTALAQDQSVPQPVLLSDMFKVVSPAANSEVTDKKPEIKVEVLQAAAPGSLVVILDGMDITQMITMTSSGFQYKPSLSLPAGQHTLLVFGLTQSGVPGQTMITFKSRHVAGAFEEAYSNNEISAVYEALLAKPDRVTSVPYSKIEGNIKSDSKIKSGPWEFREIANIRYFDQSLPANAISGVATPGSSSSGQAGLEKGFSLANFLISGIYTKDAFKSTLEVGDVQISETQNTVSGLARRGGKLSLQYKDLTVNTFLVRGDRIMGFNGGFGIEGSSADHIYGASAGIKLFNKKLEFKTVYVTGGEPGNSAGISSSGGSGGGGGGGGSTPSTSGAASRGDVLGFLLITDFFANKFRTEAELDFTRFDPDTAADLGKDNDHALRLKAGGMLFNNIYTYEARYEYYGPRYAVIGNQGAPKDSQVFAFTNGLNVPGHYANLMLTRTNNNVEGDRLFSQVVTYDGQLMYSFTKIQKLPITLSYSRNLQESKHEPTGMPEVDVVTDSVTGTISYIPGGKYTITLMSSWSGKNDKTAANTDTTTMTHSLMPVYSTGTFSLSPMLSYIRTKDHLSAVWTDTFVASMNMGSRFLANKLSFDMGGTYTKVKADNEAVNSWDLNANFRLGYSLKELFKNKIDGSVAVKGSYLRHRDQINHDANRDEFLMFLVLSTSIPLSF